MANKKLDLSPVIGLEIHVEIRTKSKIFCSCPNNSEEKIPNKNICPICLGHPGVLPTLNKEALAKILKLGLALKGEINYFSFFDRKNYFYPDLPKAYQISQYNVPFIKGGFLTIGESKVEFDNVHLEEDTAKLVHSPDNKKSFLDFNRAGIPLLEAITKPTISSPSQAKMFLKEFQLLIRYLDISEAAMEKGQMRCDANISLRPNGSEKLFPKTEIKNLNSFRAVEEALSYEINRQKKLWLAGTPPKSPSTRGWSEDKSFTFAQREKEESEDYRYFPEPDLPVYDVSSIVRSISLGEPPQERRKRFVQEYEFNLKEAEILTRNKKLADFTEEVISELKAWLVSLEEVEGMEEEIWQKYKKKLAHLVANWIINRFLPLIDGKKELSVTPENFSEFIILLYQRKISSTLGTRILEEMVKTGKDVDAIIQEGKFRMLDEEIDLEKIIKDILGEKPELVSLYRKGKTNVIHVFVGEAMKKTKGRANPEEVRKILEEKLS